MKEAGGQGLTGRPGHSSTANGLSFMLSWWMTFVREGNNTKLNSETMAWAKASILHLSIEVWRKPAWWVCACDRVVKVWASVRGDGLFPAPKWHAETKADDCAKVTGGDVLFRPVSAGRTFTPGPLSWMLLSSGICQRNFHFGLHWSRLQNYDKITVTSRCKTNTQFIKSVHFLGKRSTRDWFNQSWHNRRVMKNPINQNRNEDGSFLSVESWWLRETTMKSAFTHSH